MVSSLKTTEPNEAASSLNSVKRAGPNVKPEDDSKLYREPNLNSGKVDPHKDNQKTVGWITPERYPYEDTYSVEEIYQVGKSTTKKGITNGAGRCCPLINDIDEERQNEWRQEEALELGDMMREIVDEFRIGHRCRVAQEGNEWNKEVIPKEAAEKALEKMTEWIKKHTGEDVDVGIDRYQPFRLDIIEKIGWVIDKNDLQITKKCKEGVDIGTTEMLEPSGLWPIKQKYKDRFQADMEYKLREKNYESMEGSLFEHAVKELEKDHVNEFTVDVEKEEMDKVVAQGILACVDEGEREDGTKKVRVVWDGTMVGPNMRIRIYEAQELPTINDLKT